MATNQGFKNILIRDFDKVDERYIAYAVARLVPVMDQMASGGTFKEISKTSFSRLEIPLPSLEIQRQMVTELDGYRKIIEGARQVIANYKPTIKIDPKWPMVKLDEVCEINPKKSEVSSLDMNLSVSFVPMEDVEMVQYITPQKEKPLGEAYKGYTYFRDNDVLIARVTPCFENGKSGITRHLKNGIGFGSSELHVIRPSKKVLSEFIYPFVISNQFRSDGKIKMTGTGGLQRVPTSYVSNFEIPVPPLAIQREIVCKIEAERVLVEANRKLVEIFEEKIQAKLAEIWGEEAIDSNRTDPKTGDKHG